MGRMPVPLFVLVEHCCTREIVKSIPKGTCGYYNGSGFVREKHGRTTEVIDD